MKLQVDSKTNTGKELTKKSSRTSTKKIKSRSIIKGIISHK